jgi:hypothetical protein
MWCTPHCDIQLMTEKQILGFNRLRDLNRSATNIPSAYRIANIAFQDAPILTNMRKSRPDGIFGKVSRQIATAMSAPVKAVCTGS